MMSCLSKKNKHGSVINVLLVDDHSYVLETLRMRLELEPDIRIIDTAGSAIAAVQKAIELRPDVVVLDVKMPGAGDGIDALGDIYDATHRQNVVVLSMDDARVTRSRAFKAGAAAFVFKGEDSSSLLSAIRRVASNY